MMETRETNNRAFDEMLKVARARLSSKTPEEIAAKAKVSYDPDRAQFRLSSLGQDITVSHPDYTIKPELDPWHQLTLLHYLDMADGEALWDRLIAFGDLTHGLVRGGGFDRHSEHMIGQRLANQSPERLQAVCEGLGANMIASNADFCAVFPFLSCYPVTLKIWFADEDIPGTGRMFLDGSADHYLSVEDAVTVGTLILDRLLARLK